MIEVIVLAGGKGTRLQGVVPDVPKPMAPVNGKPFLEYILKYLKRNGVSKVVLSVGYKWEIIQEYFGDDYDGIDLVYSVENEPLGTGGAIKQALSLIEGEQALIINGDTFFDVPLIELCENVSSDTSLVLSLKEMHDFDRYGCVEIDDDNRVMAFKEKEFRNHGLINGGIYRIDKDLFDDYDLPQVFSFEEFMQDMYDRLNPSALIFDSYFIDIGIPEDYARVQLEIGLSLLK